MSDAFVRPTPAAMRAHVPLAETPGSLRLGRLLSGYTDYFRGRTVLNAGPVRLDARRALEDLGASMVIGLDPDDPAEPATFGFALCAGPADASGLLAAWAALREWGVLMTTGEIHYRDLRRILPEGEFFFLPLSSDADGRVRPFRPPLWGRTHLLVQKT